MLAGARALQGAAGALLAPAALSLLTTTFSERSERNKALGIYGAIGGSGASIGLLLGGVLTQVLDWRWVMYVNLLLAIPVVAGAFALLRDETRAARPRLDLPGTLTVSTGLFAIVFGLSHAETASWTSSLTIASLVSGVALLALFAWIESRSHDPLLPLRVLTDRYRSASLVSMLIASTFAWALFQPTPPAQGSVKFLKQSSPPPVGLY